METYFATRVDAANAGIVAMENNLKLADGYVAYEPAELRALDALEAIGLWIRSEGLDVDRLFERATHLRARRLEHLLPRPRAVVTVELSASTERWLNALAQANGVTADFVMAAVARSLADHAGRHAALPSAGAASSLCFYLDFVSKLTPESILELNEVDKDEIHTSVSQREVAAHV